MNQTPQDLPIATTAEVPARSLSRVRYWQEHIDRWRESGLGQSAYCQREGLKLHRWHYWHKKLTRAAVNTTRPASDFIPVRLRPQPLDQGLSVTLPTGITIVGISADNVALVGTLLKHL